MTSQGSPQKGDEYDEAYYEGNGQAGDRPALWLYTRLAARYLRPRNILDVGCGTGHLLRRLKQKWAADGFEISAYSARTARQNSPGSTVYESSANLPAGRYDSFTAVHVFEHIPDEPLSELLRHLRAATTPNARGLVVMPDSAGLASTLHGERWNALGDPTHVNLKSHAQWREFFARHGLRVVRDGTDGMWNFPYSTLPKPLDALRYGLPMAAQFILGRMVLKPGRGESSFFVVEWAS